MAAAQNLWVLIMQIFTKLLSIVSVIVSLPLIAGCKTLPSLPQTDPGGKAISYGVPFALMPERVTPNDATISIYQNRRSEFIATRKFQNRLYTIPANINAPEFPQIQNPTSAIMERELSNGYILSYLLFERGFIKYNGIAKQGRFSSDIDDETELYIHSSGKSVVSYLLGHAICDGYISSIDETLDWPLLSKTLYQGQPLRNLLNMKAGDQHTINESSSHVMGSAVHHRDLSLDLVVESLNGTKKIGDQMFYNNLITDLIFGYVMFKVGDDYDEFMRKIFQEKIGIKRPVSYEMRKDAWLSYRGRREVRATHEFVMTRMDFLRIGVAMMRDYQSQNCVGQYLKEVQSQALRWYKYKALPKPEDSWLWMNSYARKYGAQFYFDFDELEGRNIFGLEGRNSQIMMIDMDKSRVLVVHSAATAWDPRVFVLNVLTNGEVPH
jgi:hypothetical protein